MNHRQLTTIALLASTLGACAAPGRPPLPAGLGRPQAPALRGTLRVGPAAPATATLTVHVGRPAGYALRYLNTTDWEEATATLTQGATTIATNTVQATRRDADGLRSATFTFTGITPGAGYALAVQLKRRDASGALVACASAQNLAVTLASGANTITLPGAGLVSDGSANPGDPSGFVWAHVGSWPLAGPKGRLGHPQDAVVAADGTLYVSDPDRDAILAIGADGLIQVLAGGGPGFVNGAGASARFDDPCGLLLVGTTLYVADKNNHAIRRIDLADPNHPVVTVAGTGTAGAADGGGPNAQFSSPVALTGGPSGTLYVADQGNDLIRRIKEDPGGAIVSTFAGDGVKGFADAASALLARFDRPAGVAAVGNVLYVADLGNYRVRAIAIDLNGNGTDVWTVAGDGVAAHLDGDVPNARFMGPADLAYDTASGLLLVADTGGGRVRSVSLTNPTTTVATYAGSGQAGWLDGGAADARFSEPFGLSIGPNGPVVTDSLGARIRAIASGLTPRVSTLAGDGIQGVLAGPALDGLRPAPSGVAFDATDVPIVTSADTARLWRVPAAGAAIEFAGSGTAGFADGAPALAMFRAPRGIVRRGDGKYLVADEGNHAIRLVDATGNVSTFAGDGTPGDTDGNLATARLRAPWGLALGGDGALWVTETCGRVRRITEQPGGTIDVVTVAGANAAAYVDGVGGAAGPARFNTPRGIEVAPDGTTYVVDGGNQRIRAITADSLGGWTVSTLAGDGTANFADGPAATARFKDPRDIARGADGTLWVADGGNRRIRRIVPTGTAWTVSTAAGSGLDGYVDGPGSQARLRDPYALAFSAAGTLFVADNDNGWLRTLRF